MIKEKFVANFESSYNGGLLAVRIKGEIDHHSALSLREGIDKEIFKYRPEKLIVDLSEVDFMDSSGLGLILGRFNAEREVGGEMILLNPSRGVLKILKLAGADRLIKVETIDERTILENKIKSKKGE